MAKDYFQDITPPEHNGRSIRNISVSADRTRTARRPAAAPLPPQHTRGGRTMRAFVWVVAVACVALLGIAAFLTLRSTTVEVTPRQHTVVFDEGAQFTAYPAGAGATSSLSYTVLTHTYEESIPVEATGVEEVAERASGTITVYNEYSDDPVNLIANTRFETPEGLVYRVRNPITIPGRTDGAPGSIEATVFADEAGEEYNVGPITRFTLPGLESTPEMFESIYARSVVPMTGGFMGERPQVSDEDEAAARAQLQARLTERLPSELAVLAPSDGYVFEKLANVQFVELSPSVDAQGTVHVREQAQVSLPVFEQAAFTAAVAALTSADAGTGPINIANNESFSAIMAPDGDSVLGADPIQFGLTGTITFVWEVDTISLASDLAGKDKAAFEAIVENYPGVESAAAHIRPFWKNTFPAQPGDMVITVRDVGEAQ